ncbi:MAG TPA: hypothetical protein VFO54_06530 [Chryseosolibacter sp.]|nr:hypothetical protein [Chryseosolibacter sp.]
MKKNRWIFYSIFGLFHLISFIFTVTLDNNTSLLFKMVKWVPAFKWVTLIGLILLVIDIVWSMRTQKESDKEKMALHHELNTLKAKLFDMQEAANKQNPPPPSAPR